MVAQIIGIVGSSLGCLVAAFIFYFLVRKMLVKSLEGKTLIFVSFIGSGIIILVINSLLNGFVWGFVRYIPALFVWFLIDIIIANKKKIISENIKG
ncbi:hypothetical protein [Neobacillus cucumis]|uniref:hypothetical protein n=1 Tax=Neobacillus cucumis TaxID=1740721 RepID=UPI00285365E2|nr:hypothetical protein [Neobacillus cucumis]MDR4947792.1 hypothetical protein [Neobacillus cucumis]